jgi:hypothetical protein
MHRKHKVVGCSQDSVGRFQDLVRDLRVRRGPATPRRDDRAEPVTVLAQEVAGGEGSSPTPTSCTRHSWAPSAPLDRLPAHRPRRRRLLEPSADLFVDVSKQLVEAWRARAAKEYPANLERMKPPRSLTLPAAVWHGRPTEITDSLVDLSRLPGSQPAPALTDDPGWHRIMGTFRPCGAPPDPTADHHRRAPGPGVDGAPGHIMSGTGGTGATGIAGGATGRGPRGDGANAHRPPLAPRVPCTLARPDRGQVVAHPVTSRCERRRGRRTTQQPTSLPGDPMPPGTAPGCWRRPYG